MRVAVVVLIGTVLHRASGFAVPAVVSIPPAGNVVRVLDAAVMSSESAIAALAARAADAISDGRAHVEPLFLADDALAAARADMLSVFGTVAEGQEFESIQTDLMDPAFRQTLPTPMPFEGILSQFDELRAALTQSTGRALLDGGGLHLMRYPVGSKFMRHVDEDPEMYEPRRNSISFLLYLTPTDWADDDGGALRIYERGADSEPRVVWPVGGSLVLYDSTVEHEVLPTRRERHLISGRFRELDDDWQRGRRPA